MICHSRYALAGLMMSAALVTSQAHALAGLATPDGAQALVRTLQLYFGTPGTGEASAVTVTPAATLYKVTIDPKRLMKPLLGIGLSVESAPWEFNLTELADGTWKVDSNVYPTLNVKGPTGLDQQVKASNFKMDGVFDPATGTFRSGNYSVEQVTAAATSPGLTQNTVFGPALSSITGTAAGARAADIGLAGTLGAYNLDMVTNDKTPGKTGGDFKIGARASQMKFDALVRELHMRDLLDLWAFVVAHPGKEALGAAQADLKALLRKLMPGFSQLSENVSVAELAIETPFGKFGGKNIGFGLDVSGGVPDAHYNLALRSGALTLPPQMVPAWAINFVPNVTDLSVSVTGMNFAAAANEAINDFTLVGDKPFADSDGPKIVQALAPKGSVTVTIPPSRITSALLDVKVDGAMDAGPGMVTGTFNVTAKGLDAAMDALKAAMGKDKTAAQAFGALSIAKGMGKTGGDGALLWKIEITPDRTFLVNGAAFGGK